MTSGLSRTEAVFGPPSGLHPLGTLRCTPAVCDCRGLHVTPSAIPPTCCIVVARTAAILTIGTILPISLPPLRRSFRVLSSSLGGFGASGQHPSFQWMDHAVGFHGPQPGEAKQARPGRLEGAHRKMACCHQRPRRCLRVPGLLRVAGAAQVYAGRGAGSMRSLVPFISAGEDRPQVGVEPRSLRKLYSRFPGVRALRLTPFACLF